MQLAKPNRKYKQTEVGVIPADWLIRPIGEIAALSSGTTPPRALHDRYYTNGTVPWVKTLDLNNRSIHTTQERVTDVALHETSLLQYPIGTVLVAMYGGFGQIGRTGILRLSAAVNQALCAVQVDRRQLLPDYLLRVLNFRILYWRNVASSSRKDPNISSNDIRAFPLPLPPTLAEQEAIATALSDADGLIESLEQLIAKKRQIKHGTMQELLTGKQRLPGFSGKWETKRLGDLGATYGGLTGKTKVDFGIGTARYITFLNVMNNVRIDLRQVDNVVVRVGEYQNAVRKGDLFFNGSSETPQEVGMCSVLLEEVDNLYLNSFCFGYRLFGNDDADRMFLTYYLRSDVGRQLLFSLAQGATRHNLSKAALMAVLIKLPSLLEQSAIAAILSDMDTEIAALEAKLAKARQVKQGMMQELLTGRIRLV
jgi:type I restriction enzyme S subunit